MGSVSIPARSATYHHMLNTTQNCTFNYPGSWRGKYIDDKSLNLTMALCFSYHSKAIDTVANSRLSSSTLDPFSAFELCAPLTTDTNAVRLQKLDC